MMPRDILTTVLQTTSAEYLERAVLRRMGRALDAAVGEHPILIHSRWRDLNVCCVCERSSDHRLEFLHPREQGSETFVRGYMGICDTCARVFHLADHEREFERDHEDIFVAWIPMGEIVE